MAFVDVTFSKAFAPTNRPFINTPTSSLVRQADPSLMRQIFGTAEQGAYDNMLLAQQGRLPVPPALTLDNIAAYREIALRNIDNVYNATGQVPIVQMYRLAILQKLAEKLGGH